MTNKEFLQALSLKLSISEEEVKKLTTQFVNTLAQTLDENNNLTIQGFGTFEVKKRLERITINPTTRQQMLVPPKLTLNFKPGPTLKEKFK